MRSSSLRLATTKSASFTFAEVNQPHRDALQPVHSTHTAGADAVCAPAGCGVRPADASENLSEELEDFVVHADGTPIATAVESSGAVISQKAERRTASVERQACDALAARKRQAGAVLHLCYAFVVIQLKI